MQTLSLNNNLARCGDQEASTSVNSTARGEERSTVSVCCDSPEFQESVRGSGRSDASFQFHHLFAPPFSWAKVFCQHVQL